MVNHPPFDNHNFQDYHVVVYVQQCAFLSLLQLCVNSDHGFAPKLSSFTWFKVMAMIAIHALLLQFSLELPMP